jgi:hypothetical protein
VHNTQEIKTIDFDDFDFLSQDNIFKKPTWSQFVSAGDLIDVANFD